MGQCTSSETYLSGTTYGDLCCPKPSVSTLATSGGSGSYVYCNAVTANVNGVIVPAQQCVYTHMADSGGTFIVPPGLTSLRADVYGGSAASGHLGAHVYRNDFSVTPGDIYTVIVGQGAGQGAGGYSAFGKCPNGLPSGYVFTNPGGSDDCRLVTAGGAGGGPFIAGDADTDTPYTSLPITDAKAGSQSSSTGQTSSSCASGALDGCAIGGGGGFHGGGAGTDRRAGGAGGTSSFPSGWSKELTNSAPSVSFTWTDQFSCRFLYTVAEVDLTASTSVTASPVSVTNTVTLPQLTISSTQTIVDATVLVQADPILSISTEPGSVSTARAVSTYTADPEIVTQDGSTYTATVSTSSAVTTIDGSVSTQTVEDDEVATATSQPARKVVTRTRTSTKVATVSPTATPKLPVYKVVFPSSCCPSKSQLARRSEDTLARDLEMIENLRRLDADLYSSLTRRAYGTMPNRPAWASTTFTDNGPYKAIAPGSASSTFTSTTGTTTISLPGITVSLSATVTQSPVTVSTTQHTTSSTTADALVLLTTTTLAPSQTTISQTTTVQPTSTLTAPDVTLTQTDVSGYSVSEEDSTRTISLTRTSTSTFVAQASVSTKTKLKVETQTITKKPVASAAPTIEVFRQKKCYGQPDDKHLAAAIIRGLRTNTPSHKIIVDCGSKQYTI